jgi:hypothetical protein
MEVLYATFGVFDKGGISRYGRFQIRAIRDLMGDASVRVVFMLGPDADSFETPFHVDWFCAHPHGRRAQVATAAAILRVALQQRPDVVPSAHVNLSGVGRLAARLAGARSVVQVYGSEIWADRRWSATWGLMGSDAEVYASNFMTTAATHERIGPAERALDDLAPYYFEPDKPAESRGASRGDPRSDDGTPVTERLSMAGFELPLSPGLLREDVENVTSVCSRASTDSDCPGR